MIRSIYEKRKILSITCFYYVPFNQIFVKNSSEKMSRKLHPGSEQIKDGQPIWEMNGIWLLSVSDIAHLDMNARWCHSVEQDEREQELVTSDVQY